MNIVRLETFLVQPRWLFLRVETDDGLIGWGEPVVEGRAQSVATAVDEMSDLLIGADASRIEDIWQTLVKGGFYRGGPVLSSAIAGIDQALWDIKGKALGVPVYELLGGPVRDKVRIYSWIHGDEPEELADAARRAVEAGFDAVKFNGSDRLRPLDTPAQVKRLASRTAAVRDAIGDRADLAIDFHGRASTAMVRRMLPPLEEHLPLFVEEPVLPEYSRDLGHVVQSTSIPVALGERLYSRWDFRDVLTTGVAVLQPDLSHAGGISEVRRIAAMAETHDAQIAPHCPLGPIAFAACLQIDLAIPNFLIQEQSLGIGYTTSDAGPLDYLVNPAVFAQRDGHILRSTAPGLGVEIDEAAVRKAAATGHRWRNPLWRHADGSFAEW
ncbi:galactonate dehydratase [Streptomyces sp. NPDC002262]|uniref:galactonate dehydratase n=1 Tax=Streptomyces sp. NPDC002262 TaxID=3154414 RepID=UPI003330F1F1